MRAVEVFLGGVVTLIVLYLLFNSQSAGNVIQSLAGGASQVFGTLQGRRVSGAGVSVG